MFDDRPSWSLVLLYTLQLLRDNLLQSIQLSDPLVFRLAVNGRTRSGRIGDVVDREICGVPSSEGRSQSVELRYPVSSLEIPVSVSIPYVADDAGEWSFIESIIDQVFTSICDGVNRALYVPVRPESDVIAISNALVRTPTEGIFLGRKREIDSNYALRNGAWLGSFSSRGLQIKDSTNLPTDSDLLVVDNTTFGRLSRSISPFQRLVREDMANAHFRSFMWRGREVITPTQPLLLSPGLSYLLASGSLELVLDHESLTSLEFWTEGDLFRARSRIGMQLVFNQFNNQGVIVTTTRNH